MSECLMFPAYLLSLDTKLAASLQMLISFFIFFEKQWIKWRYFMWLYIFQMWIRLIYCLNIFLYSLLVISIIFSLKFWITQFYLLENNVYCQQKHYVYMFLEQENFDIRQEAKCRINPNNTKILFTKGSMLVKHIHFVITKC